MQRSTDDAGKTILDAMQEIARRSAPAISEVTTEIRRSCGITITPSLFSLLGELKNGPLRLTHLANNLGLSQPTTSLHVQELQRNGLIVRVQDSTDRRSTIIELSETGRIVGAMVDGLRESIFGRVFSGWEEDDVMKLAHLLLRLRDDVGGLSADRTVENEVSDGSNDGDKSAAEK
jgi:DNA-binding MarR family transcriptional regulator